MKQITTYFVWLNIDLFTRKSIITEFCLNAAFRAQNLRKQNLFFGCCRHILKRFDFWAHSLIIVLLQVATARTRWINPRHSPCLVRRDVCSIFPSSLSLWMAILDRREVAALSKSLVESSLPV